ncbi:MAG TPA: sugar phosphate isomerase/epimerase [Verrucomicrobiae bacterium]|nr:sugar phosphate isomerase/epimerase [Verrucomicrobiae bacterium]
MNIPWKSSNSDRRQFLKQTLLAGTVIGTGLVPGGANAALTKPERDPCHGLKLGLTSYTLRNFTLDQALKMAKVAGVKYISLKDMHLPLKSTRQEREEAHRKVTEAGLVLMGGGVIYMKNEPEVVRAAFEYARDGGMPTIICSPEPSALDLVESLAKEYDIKIAIHNHGPDNNSYPSPLDVLRLIKDRDPHMGICMDVGHTVRIGQDPIAAIRQCAPRLYDFHMKDVTAPTKAGKPVEVGRGIIDIVGVLKALLRIKYSGNVALEYEAKGDAPLPGMTESFGYIRGVLAVI